MEPENHHKRVEEGLVIRDNCGCFRWQLLSRFVILAKIIRVVSVNLMIIHCNEPTFNDGCSADFKYCFVSSGSPTCQRFVIAALVAKHYEFQNEAAKCHTAKSKNCPDWK